MSAPTATSTESLRPDEQSLARYRAVCRMAVLAAGLGLVSPVVLASPLLAPVGIAAVVTAALALRAMAASGGQLIGRGAALAGLCLATLFLGWGFTRHFTRQSTVEEHARRTAQAFLEVLQAGKIKEALQFREAPAARITSPEALAEHYQKDPEAARSLQTFSSQQSVKDLLTLGSAANLRFDGVVSSTHDGFSDNLTLRYSYDRPQGNGSRQPLWIYVNRRMDERSKRSEWVVGALDTNPPINSQ